MPIEEELIWVEATTSARSFMTDNGYHKTLSDHCVFVKKFDGGDFLIDLLYVDDMIIVGRDHSKIRELKKALSRSF